MISSTLQEELSQENRPEVLRQFACWCAAEALVLARVKHGGCISAVLDLARPIPELELARAETEHALRHLEVNDSYELGMPANDCHYSTWDAFRAVHFATFDHAKYADEMAAYHMRFAFAEAAARRDPTKGSFEIAHQNCQKMQLEKLRSLSSGDSKVTYSTVLFMLT